MGTRMIVGVLGCSLLFVSGWAVAQSTWDAESSGASLEAIRRQAGNQDALRAQMGELVRSFRVMVADMASNSNLPPKKAAEIVRLVNGLTLTDATHVRKAAELLRQAYADERAHDTGARRDSLEAAGTELQNALDKLNGLLRLANALHAAELINAELQAVIHAQEALQNDSKAVGRELLAGLSKLSFDPARIAADQDKLAERTSKIQELVRLALAEELTPDTADRLGRAMKFLDSEKIDARMLMASRNIEQRDILPGLDDQRAALLSLRQLAAILNPDGASARKGHAAAGDPGRKGPDGAEKPGGLNPADPSLASNAPDMGVPDKNAGDKNSPADAAPKPAVAANTPPRDVADPPSARAPKQAPGAAANKGVLTPAPGGSSQGARSPSGLGAGNKDKTGLGDSRGKQGGGKPTTPGDQAGPNQGPPNAKASPALAASPKAGPVSGQGNTNAFKSAGLYGDRTGEEATEAAAGNLPQRDQMVLNENFASDQDLPREYRQMLKTYYDRLSRE
ncbi:MAG: hypothetical protein NTV86_23010 [Planctomycetota bacterium]|nr:hypothetical protein [Planctomycetota bacterium]